MDWQNGRNHGTANAEIERIVSEIEARTIKLQAVKNALIGHIFAPKEHAQHEVIAGE